MAKINNSLNKKFEAHIKKSGIRFNPDEACLSGQ
jgi:hypothetical protein